MDPAAESADLPEEGSRSLVVERHSARRPLGRLFWLSFVAVPVALAALAGMSSGPAVEDSLRGEAQAALAAEGIKKVGLVVDGRQVTAEVPTGNDPQQVQELLATVPGVQTVQATEVFASKREARACENVEAKLERATNGQRIGFVGGTAQLSADGRRMVAQVASLLKACRAVDVTVGGHSNRSTTNFATVSLWRAQSIIRVLKQAGIESERLTPRGYGNQFPIAKNDSPAEYAKNERGSVAVEGH